MILTPKDHRVRYIVDGNIKIRPKSGGKAIPLVPSNVQRKVLTAIEEDVAMGRPIRQIDLKPRQVMMSSIIAAWLFSWAILEEGVSILVAAQKEGTVSDLWTQKYQTFLRNTEPEPETDNDSAKRMKFAENGSYIDVRIGSPDLGRGGTRQGIHLTEYPYMKDPKIIWDELIPCVPKEPNTAIFVESTGAKPGDDYEKMFRDSWEAQKRGQLLEYRALFFPWTDQEDYYVEMSDAEQRKFKEKLDAEERYLLDTHKGMTYGHLAWRRMILHEMRGDVASFINKYPLTPDEAFSARRESCFDPDSMLFYRQAMIRDPEFKVTISLSPRKEPIIRETEIGELWVWQKAMRPSAYSRFTMYLDPAGYYGVETEDYHSQSAIAVVDNDNGEVVATWTGIAQPADFARIGYAVGSLFNNATLVVETNNHGHLVFHELLQLGYKNLWYNDTVSSNIIEKQRGFIMNMNSRREIVDKFQELIHHRRLGLHCSRTYQQMESFIKPLAGSQRAKKGHRDDLVIAAAGASWVASRHAEWGSRERQIDRAARADSTGPTKNRVWQPMRNEDMNEMRALMGLGPVRTRDDTNLFDMIMTRS